MMQKYEINSYYKELILSLKSTVFLSLQDNKTTSHQVETRQ